MKTVQMAFSAIAPAIVALAFAACPNPGKSSDAGSLSIQIANNIPSRTLGPSLSMVPTSFTVSGTGPGGATFSQSSTGGAVTVNSLAFGSWSITVNAYNAALTTIGSGQATATVNTGQTTTVSISVVPLAGNGTLSLTVTWPASQVQTPSIQATLTPLGATSPVTTLSFSIAGSQGTYSSSSIPAGYQTLSLQVLDNNIPVAGAADVVRIVAGQTTAGTYAFTNVNAPGGALQVTVTPTLANPIPLNISGVTATVTAGNTVTATASTGDGTSNVVYTWFLNGVSQATGSAYTFGNTLADGSYRLDLVANTPDLSRGGSTSMAFAVAPRTYTTSFPLTESPISESGNWINGAVVGLDWNNVVTTPGLAQGQGPSSVPYSDPTALLTGPWGPNQTAQATVYTVNPNESGMFQEVELRLRSSLSAHSATGYEIDYACRQDSTAYTVVVRWNGALGDFTNLLIINGPQSGVANGDVVKATIVGNLISVYRNGTLIGTVTDTTYTTGSPGIGFDYGCGTTYPNFGFTSFTATDSP